MEMLG